MPKLGRIVKGDDGMAALARYSMFMDIKLNITKTALKQAASDELKATSFIWAYRMLYYPYFGDKLDWYACASALYMKEKFTGNSFYRTGVFQYVGVSPFNPKFTTLSCIKYCKTAHKV